MLFNSFDFIAFLLITLALYYAVPSRWRLCLLAIIGWYFYAFAMMPYTVLLIASTTLDFWIGRSIPMVSSRAKKKSLVVVSLAFNLGVLCFFKYTNFFLGNIEWIAHQMGSQWTKPFFLFVLPAGISFYTFQSLSYVVDVYRGECEPRKRFWEYAAYLTFFPQLVAGPIERASHLINQIMNPSREVARNWLPSLHLICRGLFKKLVVADNIARFVELAFDEPVALSSAWISLLGMYCFTVQIYCDFSGYTDVGRGVARLFGIDLMMNFRQPYRAESMTDFWRRWHISLSTWFSDYVYKPLGGNRVVESMMLRNLMITMVIAGFWHGASWMFVFWGVYHGALLCAEKLWGLRLLETLPKRIREFLVFHVVCFGLVIFRCKNLGDFQLWLSRFGDWSWDPRLLQGPVFITVAFLLVTFGSRKMAVDQRDPAEEEMSWGRRSAAIAVLLAGISLFGLEKARLFIYFYF